MKERILKAGKLKRLPLAFAAVGLLSLLYSVYDIARPNHFVGDMYGLEVMFRAFMLLILSAVMFAGLMLMLFGGKNGETPRTAAVGVVFASACSAVFILLSINVCLSRHQDNVRKTYPRKSTRELARIAAEERDQFAIYELIARRDPAAVPGLRQMLLDDDQDLNIRMEAAHALGCIGGEASRQALEQARAAPVHPRLKDALHYALEELSRGALPNPAP